MYRDGVKCFAKELGVHSSTPPEHSGHSRYPKLNLRVCKAMQRLLQGGGIFHGAPTYPPRKLVPWLHYSGLLPPAASPLSSPPPSPSDFETLPILSGSYHLSLFLYTYELFRSGPKLQFVGVVLWGQGALETKQLAASRAVRKFLPGLAEH